MASLVGAEMLAQPTDSAAPQISGTPALSVARGPHRLPGVRGEPLGRDENCDWLSWPARGGPTNGEGPYNAVRDDPQAGAAVDSANRGQCSVAGGFCGRHSAGAHVLCSWRERAGHGSARSWDLWPAESGAASSAEPGTMAEVAVSG